MKLVEMNWQPSARQLRQFGLVCLVALPLLGWIWGGSQQTIVGLSLVGICLALAAVLRPPLLKPVFVGFSLAAIPIGLVVGEVAMLLIYFGVFLPIAVAFRLCRRDSLKREVNRSRTTYWESKPQPTHAGSYYRQS